MAATADDCLHTFDGAEPSTGERILELADGTHSVEVIAAIIQHEFEGCSAPQALVDVQEFVSLLVERQVLILHAQPLSSTTSGQNLQEQRP